VAFDAILEAQINAAFFLMVQLELERHFFAQM
jgi:hypothetical protein